ncbi:uncharacterized protein LOC114331258 [Diabrotica virgifera virgifera]|uniref:Peroxisomal ATPase PEX1 n=1 Tax=Diabrotica virgifera virgifera TaxID=50390 RepID=A0A6P7FKA0_DIAVI|nr:uncharacterized protein LOC114331258 [Diabrotica virgifera virgifera]
MFERNLILKYLPVKDSFLYTCPNLKFLKTGACVKVIINEDHVVYFSIGDTSVELDDNCIGLNSLFARTLNLDNNILVRVSEVPSFPSVSSLTVFPVNRNEYEVMEMLADNIQDTLLSQIRVVYTGQKIVIWIGNNINVTVCVGNVNPVSPGAIDFLTEVHIEEYFHKPLEDNTVTAGSNQIADKSDLKLFSNFIKASNSTNPFEKYITLPSELLFRVVPLNKVPFSDNSLLSDLPFTIYLFKDETSEDISPCKIFRLSLLTNDVFAKDIYARLMFIENFDLNKDHELYVDEDIVSFFDCPLGARMSLKPVDKYPFVSEIQINANKNYTVDVIETFKRFLAKGTDQDNVFVLNSDIPIDIGDNIVCNLKFFPDEPKFCVIDDHLVRSCKYFLNIENVIKEKKKSKDQSVHILKDISNFKPLIDDTVNDISRLTENVLITGKPGTGKSTLLSEIARNLCQYPNFLFIKEVKCKSIKGKTMDSLHKFFSNIFSELLLHQPSVLILDDLHILCENVHGEEAAPNFIYFSRISEMLYNFLKLVSPLNKITILASSESTDKLNKNIYTSRGNHLFKNIYSIEELTKANRISAIQFLFKDFTLDNDACNDLAIKTEGFVIQDLVDFSNKTLFEIYKHEPEDTTTTFIKSEYLETALKNTTVMSLQNVQLHSPGDKNFSSIGGLHEIKEVLLENLLWPGQYPNIFANAPLRLQSGLLLYGPPGTGKTLIAAAAAKQCGLRLISVKGPELLSKYIGASEQAVRDIFQKAQSARPCILFFDEFDSLAPRRGHDNTGVTDRVVNQLLTQLDGVESLTGVCVLAATSRPDLLDSALLRPGRLDKQLLCPLPNEEDRYEILKVLSKNLNLSDDVSLEDISIKTQNYSGADLQSLLYSAHMLTIDYSFENDKVVTQDTKINQAQLVESLRKTKPSLSNQERLKYERIYTKFQSGSTIDDLKRGSKATLA